MSATLKHKTVLLCSIPLLGIGVVAGLFLMRARTPPESPEPKPPAALPKRIGEHHWQIPSSAKLKYLEDPSHINSEVHLKPVVGKEPDSVTDLVIAHLAPGSPLHTAGFRVDDHILKVNGSAVSTLGRATNLIHEIRASTQLSVQVQREGKVIDYLFEFQ